ncbi:MAG: glycosyltransferase family 4 protein [Dehalococcoidia bacterium]|nr:glycosyltransferase family 4 protein [Dehalococcoidia bacterium]
MIGLSLGKSIALKICIVASSYPRFHGDIAGVFVRSLAEELHDLGHEIHILAPYSPLVAPQFEAEIPVTHFRFAPLKRLHRMGYAEAMINDRELKLRSYFLIPLYLLCGSLALLRLCREKSFDVINSHWVVPNTPLCLLPSRRAGIPIVTTLHGSDMYLARSSFMVSLAARVSFAKSAGITACSEEMKDGAMALGAAPDSVHVIPWGVRAGIFKAGSGVRWRHTLDISSGRPVALAAGRVVEKKGFEYLVRAAPDVLRKLPDTVFVIAGQGEQLPYLRDLTRTLGIESSFRFPGLIPWNEMPAILNMCDLFVAPSIHDSSGNVDGLPTVVLEAMAAGKPVVATRVAGLPLVVRDRVNGFLVDEKDSEQLAEAILTLILDDEMRRTMAAQSLRIAENELTWRNTALRFQNVFQQALSSKYAFRFSK